MKNFTDFLTHKTPVSEHYGKVLKELNPLVESKIEEIEKKKLELTELLYKKDFVHDEVKESIRPFYKKRNSLKIDYNYLFEDMRSAIEKAKNWNKNLT